MIPAVPSLLCLALHGSLKSVLQTIFSDPVLQGDFGRLTTDLGSIRFRVPGADKPLLPKHCDGSPQIQVNPTRLSDHQNHSVAFPYVQSDHLIDDEAEDDEGFRRRAVAAVLALRPPPPPPKLLLVGSW